MSKLKNNHIFYSDQLYLVRSLLEQDRELLNAVDGVSSTRQPVNIISTDALISLIQYRTAALRYTGLL